MLWWQWAAFAVLVAGAAYLADMQAASSLAAGAEPSLARRAAFVAAAVAATLVLWVGFRRLRPSTHRTIRLWVLPPMLVVAAGIGAWLALRPGGETLRSFLLLQSLGHLAMAVLFVRDQRRADRRRAASADAA